MSEVLPEPRTAVMILVEASWVDQNGTVQRVTARMENRSSSGACIRIKKKIGVGSKLRIQWRWEEFSGTTKYCRSFEKEYLVGLQRDSGKIVDPATTDLVEVSNRDVGLIREAADHVAQPAAEGKIERQIDEKSLSSRDRRDPNSVPLQVAVIPNETPHFAVRSHARDGGGTSDSADLKVKQDLSNGNRQGISSQCEKKEIEIQHHGMDRLRKEGEQMKSKWLELGSWKGKEEESSASGKSNGAPATEDRLHAAAGVAEKLANQSADAESQSLPGELFSMEEIYRAAGIVSPRRGYGIGKVLEMLGSEHLRGLPKEMKRASVLMALDASGTSVDEILRDAKARHEAADLYEAEQRKELEQQWAHKAEENIQIQLELERIKTQHSERIRRNQELVAREKATFGNWLAMKQQEAQNMFEAAELCVKAPVPEPLVESVVNSFPGTKLVSASTKSV